MVFACTTISAYLVQVVHCRLKDQEIKDNYMQRGGGAEMEGHVGTMESWGGGLLGCVEKGRQSQEGCTCGGWSGFSKLQSSTCGSTWQGRATAHGLSIESRHLWNPCQNLFQYTGSAKVPNPFIFLLIFILFYFFVF